MENRHHGSEYRQAADASLTEQLESRLSEAWQSLWDNVVDSREPFYDDGTDWIAMGALPGSSPLAKSPYFNEAQLRDIRDQCRVLAVANEFAINGHENRISYLVGPGHTYRAAPKTGCDAPPELSRQVQDVMDDFIVANAWHRRQQEIVRRIDRDGEAFLRFFALPNGVTRVRFVEPGQVATPTDKLDDPAATFGILTEPDDVETPLAYYIDAQPVDAYDIQHRKANVDVNVKRGLPLYYSVRKNLRRAEKLLRNMSVVAEIQSAIALIRKHRGATKSGVQQFVAGQSDVSVASAATGQTTNYRRFGPGTILDSHGGIEYDFPASALDAANYVAVLQAELRAIASRLVMPEFMFTSDASNANFASTMAAEGPALRMFARLQADLVTDDLQVMWRVVRVAVEAGRLPADALSCVEIQAEPPTLETRDALKEAQAFRIEFQSGILSPQTWSQRRGLDYDQEQANWKQYITHGAQPSDPRAR
ncbi:MAG TPA: phage portal protein [Pirellulales bacterium]|nr:phage portal protein [Pirellulales bacterium]